MYKKNILLIILIIIIINLLTNYNYTYSIFESIVIVLEKVLFFTLYIWLDINAFLTKLSLWVLYCLIYGYPDFILFFLYPAFRFPTDIISIIFFTIIDPLNLLLFTIYESYCYFFLYITNYEIYNALDFLLKIQHLNYNVNENTLNINPWFIKGVHPNDHNFYLYTIFKDTTLIPYHSWYKYFYPLILLEFINASNPEMLIAEGQVVHIRMFNFFYERNYSELGVLIEIIKIIFNENVQYFYNMYLTYSNMHFGPIGPPIPLDINNINNDFFDYANDPMSKDFFDEIKRFNEEKNRLKKLYFLAFINKLLKLTPYKRYKHDFNSTYKRFYKVSTPLFVFTQQYINHRLKSYYFSDVVFRAMRQKPSILSKLLRNFGINIPIDIIFNIICIYFNKYFNKKK